MPPKRKKDNYRKAQLGHIEALQKRGKLRHDINLDELSTIELRRLVRRNEKKYLQPSAMNDDIREVKKKLLELKKAGKVDLEFNEGPLHMRTVLNDYYNNSEISKHFPTKHPNVDGIQLVDQKDNDRTFYVHISPPENRKYFRDVQELPLEAMTPALAATLKEFDQLKFSIKLKMMQSEDDVFSQWSHSGTHEVFSLDDLPDAYQEIREDLVRRLELQGATGSGAAGYSFHDTKVIELQIVKTNISGREGGKYVRLPKEFPTRAVININNSMSELRKSREFGEEYAVRCFMFCILYHFYAEMIGRNPQRVSKYAALRDTKEFCLLNRDVFFRFTDPIVYPIHPRHKARFERMLNVQINIYEYKDKKVTPVMNLRKSRGLYKDSLDLLLYKGHYMYIKNFNALMRPRNTRCMLYTCHYCLRQTANKETHETHEESCGANQVITLPPEGTCMEFKNSHYRRRAPYYLVADTECLLVPQPDGSPTVHIPFEIGARIIPDKRENFEICEEVKFLGLDCVPRFVKWLKEKEGELLDDIAEDPYPDHNLSFEEELEFQAAEKCYLCLKPFKEEDGNEEGIKVRDHSHRTGKYRGATHQGCNINFASRDRRRQKIPVFFHNAMGYDNHFIIDIVMKEITNDVEDKVDELVRKRRKENFQGNPECVKNETMRDWLNPIGESAEKLKQFCFRSFVFRDSFKHLNKSLAVLVKNLPDEAIVYGRIGFDEERDSEIMKIMRYKQPMMYNYLTSLEKLEYEGIPPREESRDELTGKLLPKEDYELMKKIYNHFGMKKFGDYVSRYLLSDIRLLADVIENHRDNCIDANDSVDPVHYVSGPSMFWDTFLLKSQAKIEIPHTLEIYNTIMSGKYGGICQVIKHFSEANNKYLPNHDRTKPTRFIHYYDANNLYGKAMMLPVPVGEMHFIPNTKENFEMAMKTPLEAEYGYWLVVDIIHPVETQDFHNDYPPAPRKMKMDMSLHSPLTKQLDGEIGRKRIVTEKLHSTFLPKKEYSTHYATLQSYIRNKGVKVTKVHRILKFKQLPIMKEYIEANTAKRAKATTPSMKDYYKLANNALFGKSITDTTKLKKFNIVDRNSASFVKLTSKPTFERFKPFKRSSHATLQMGRPTATVKYPVQIGCTILEHAKRIQYEFFCRLKRYFGPKIRIILTDTDSFVFDVTDEDPDYDGYRDLKENFSDICDFSNYPKDHFMYNDEHKQIPGYYKDEYAGKAIESVIAIRPKCYLIRSINLEKGSTDMEIKVKGITRAGKEEIDYDDFLQHVKGGKGKKVKQASFVSEGHEIRTVIRYKDVFGEYTDDKRYQIDGIDTNAIGYYKNNSR